MHSQFKNNRLNILLLSLPLSRVLAGLLLFIAFSPLVAQAPTDEWRRGGFDAMVAEPGMAGSILSNPAGIKTNEERHRFFSRDQSKPGKKTEWIFELLSGDFVLSKDTWTLLQNPSSLTNKVQAEIEKISELSQLTSGDGEATSGDNFELLTGLPKTVLDDIFKGVTVPNGKTPSTMNADDFKALDGAELKKIAKNLANTESLLSSLINGFTNRFSENLGDLGGELYSRLFTMSHVNNKKPLAWGFSLGWDQKVVLRTNVDGVSMPVSMNVGEGANRRTVSLTLPFAMQAYAVVPIRVAFAHNFALPGFTFGLGAKVVPYLGMNQDNVGKLLSDVLVSGGNDTSSLLNVNQFTQMGGVNLGVDFGVQYHFGAISPSLDFLHAGLKISDIIGFNVPFASDKGEELRYAIDFDMGVYAEHQTLPWLQTFGGMDLIQMRGLFGDTSPYSALFTPIEHLRVLAGVAFLKNTIRINVQYYNNYISPGITFNLAGFQLKTAYSAQLDQPGSWGLEVGMRIRSPHNDFNKRTPYKTYSKSKADTDG